MTQKARSQWYVTLNPSSYIDPANIYLCLELIQTDLQPPPNTQYVKEETPELEDITAAALQRSWAGLVEMQEYIERLEQEVDICKATAAEMRAHLSELLGAP